MPAFGTTTSGVGFDEISHLQSDGGASCPEWTEQVSRPSFSSLGTEPEARQAVAVRRRYNGGTMAVRRRYDGTVGEDTVTRR